MAESGAGNGLPLEDARELRLHTFNLAAIALADPIHLVLRLRSIQLFTGFHHFHHGLSVLNSLLFQKDLLPIQLHPVVCSAQGRPEHGNSFVDFRRMCIGQLPLLLWLRDMSVWMKEALQVLVGSVNCLRIDLVVAVNT